jgi:hypothetical protein
MTSAAGFSDTTKYVEWADSGATAGWVTREKFRLDTTYKAAQLLLRVRYTDSGTTYSSFAQFRDSLANARNRYVWKPDSGVTYASFPQFRDSLAAHWSQLLLRVLYSDTGTTAAKIPKVWYLWNQIQDSLAEYVLRANSVLTGTTTAASIVPSGTSGQFGWFTRNATAPASGKITPSTATDTLQVPVIYGGTTPALFMDASKNVYATGLVYFSAGTYAIGMNGTRFSTNRGGSDFSGIDLLNGAGGGVVIDQNVGRARATVGSLAGTGAGKLYLGDSLYHATTLVMDGSRNLLNIGTIGSGAITSTGTVSGTAFSANSGSVTTSVASFTGVNTKANILELYRSASATAVATVDTTGLTTVDSIRVTKGVVATNGTFSGKTGAHSLNVAVNDASYYGLLIDATTAFRGMYITGAGIANNIAGSLNIGTGTTNVAGTGGFYVHGLSELRTLAVGQRQNTTLTPFLVKNFAGTNVITGDTTGIGSFTKLKVGTIGSSTLATLDSARVKYGSLDFFVGGTRYEAPNLAHGYCQFSDSSRTLDLTQNVWQKVTNSGNTLFISVEFDEVTFAGDSITVSADRDGDYYMIAMISFNGTNNDDFEWGIAKNGVLVFKTRASGTGAANRNLAAVQAYLNNLTAGDDLALWVRNITNNNDVTLMDGNIYIRREHN